MITALISTITCFQKLEQELLAKNKSLILVTTELFNKSKRKSYFTTPARHSKSSTSGPIHLFCLHSRLITTCYLGSNVKSASYNIFQTTSLIVDWSCRDISSRVIRISDSTTVVRFPPVSFAFQGRDFTPSVIGVDQVLSASGQHAIESEDWRSTFSKLESKKAGISVIFLNNIVVATIKRSISDITIA